MCLRCYITYCRERLLLMLMLNETMFFAIHSPAMIRHYDNWYYVTMNNVMLLSMWHADVLNR